VMYNHAEVQIRIHVPKHKIDMSAPYLSRGSDVRVPQFHPKLLP
jgi:hypothetical protein